MGTFPVLLSILYYSSYLSILALHQLLSSVLLPAVRPASRSLPILLLRILALGQSHVSEHIHILILVSRCESVNRFCYVCIPRALFWDLYRKVRILLCDRQFIFSPLPFESYRVHLTFAPYIYCTLFLRSLPSLFPQSFGCFWYPHEINPQKNQSRHCILPHRDSLPRCFDCYYHVIVISSSYALHKLGDNAHPSATPCTGGTDKRCLGFPTVRRGGGGARIHLFHYRPVSCS